MNNKVCTIISGGKKSNLNNLRDSFIIACDKGYEYAKEKAITPNLIIGDFDSLEMNVDNSLNIIKLPIEKDDTDTMSAIKYALDHKYNEIDIYCALGGRLDHLLGNIQSASFATKKGAKVTIYDDENELHFIHNDSIEIPYKKDYSISVLSLSDKSTHVSIDGAKYKLDKATLTNAYPIGISNEWEDTIKVSVQKGIVLVIMSKK